MTTNFFKNLASLNLEGAWKIIISTDKTGKLAVSYLFNAACGDKAVHLIVPHTLTGTAEEIDEAFFDKVTGPVIKNAGLQDNLEAHLKSMEAAKLASKLEQDNKTAATKSVATAAKKTTDHELPDPKAEKRTAYEAIMKEIALLNDDCKYEESIALLPAIEDYPEKESELKKLRVDLIRKNEQKKQVSIF